MSILGEAGYKIHIRHGLERVNPADGNVDVEVRFEGGSRYSATVFTLRNIRWIFEKNMLTGECGGGLWFRCPDMVIVRELTEEAIAKTVADLIREGEFEQAFIRLEPLEEADDLP